VEDVRIGKIIEMHVADGRDMEAVTRGVASMCEKLLANPVTESYRIEVEP